MQPNRRHIIAGLAALPFATAARGQALVPELVAGTIDDQSGTLQEAMLRAAAEGLPLRLPPGTFYVQNLQVPSNLLLHGVPGATTLAAAGVAPVLRIAGSAHVRFENVVFGYGAGGPEGAEAGLLEIEASEHVTLSNCAFSGGKASGIAIHDAAAEIDTCDFLNHAIAAVFSVDSRGVTLTGNRVSGCGNGGIVVIGSTSRRGAATVLGNSISRIGASNGGVGQTGNGIYVQRCDDVVVANNRIADCAFTAIRLNATSNVVVSGNMCRNSGDVAILAEDAYSAAVVADNVVDNAALGIAVAGMAQAGQIATVTGNVVRNIRDGSPVNPDTKSAGIYVEAETTVTGNTVYTVAGTGIRAGTNGLLRNVVIADNIIRSANTGIGVSVASGSAPGPVSITGNMIGASGQHSIVGLDGERVVTDNLARDAARFPQVHISSNVLG